MGKSVRALERSQKYKGTPWILEIHVIPLESSRDSLISVTEGNLQAILKMNLGGFSKPPPPQTPPDPPKAAGGAPPPRPSDERTDERTDGRTKKKSKCVSNDRSGHGDQFCPKIVKIGAILKG